MRRGRALSLAILLGLFLAVGVFDHDVWPPTEPTVAGVVWDLLHSGDWIVPRINGLPYLEKPPLYYWSAALAARLGGGLSPGALRLPAALLGLAALGAVFWVLRARHGEIVAWIAVLLGATSALFYEIAHRACTDIAATAFAFGCWALYARTLADGGVDGRMRWRLDLAFCGLLAVSFYAKNFYTFLVVLPPVLGHLLVRRRTRRALFLAAGVGLATLVVVAPWALGLWQRAGASSLRVVFFDNTLGRFFTFHHLGFAPGPLNNAFDAEKQSSPFFYLGRLLAVSAPWSLLWIAAAIFLIRRRPWDDHRLFAVLGLAAVPAVLTLSSSKTTEYLIPVLFFGVLAMAELLAEPPQGEAGRSRLEEGLLAANLLAVGAVLVLGPLVVGMALGPLWVAWLSLPLAAGAAWLLWRWLRGGRDEAAWLAFTRAAAVGLAVLLFLAIPGLDARKSYAPFFETVRRDASSRPVLTSFDGDHALPLMTYYLRREVEQRKLDQIWTALAGSQPVAALVPDWAYEGRRELLAQLPGVRMEAEDGRGRMVLLVNRGDLLDSGPPREVRP